MAHHEHHKHHVLTEQETEELIAHFDRESNVRRFTGVPDLLIKGLLLLFAAYVFWVTVFANLPEQVRRCAFVGILVFIGFLLYPIHRSMTRRHNYIPWYDVVLGTLGAVSFFYYVVNFQPIIARAIRPVSVRFYSFGAGMKTDWEEGQTMERDGDALIISGFDRTFTELNYIVGTVSDHLLMIGGETISLRDRYGKNAHITLRSN